MQILHCPTAVVKRKASCSFRSRRRLVGYTTLPISFLPSFLADFLVRPRGVLLLLLPNLHSLSPSFQVIDVLSLRRIHQRGGGILGRSEEASQEGLANNSALSSFLVLQMFCRPPSSPHFFLLGSGPICRFGGGHGLHGSLDCQVRHHPSGPLPASAQQRSLSGILGRPPHNCMHAFSHAWSCGNSGAFSFT